MRREAALRRSDWRGKCEAVGFDFHTTIDDYPYWDESVCYAFTEAEINLIEQATVELHRMCLEAVDWIVRQSAYDELGIPLAYGPLVAQSWRDKEPSLFGRFDLAFDGTHLKLLEYNADTPTSVLETAVVQWYWLKDTHPTADQFNSLHERLIARWRDMCPAGELVHFACDLESYEDLGNVRYLMDVACQAGCTAKLISLKDIGIKHGSHEFVDREFARIRRCFKLYPWEWMFTDAFGAKIESHTTRFVEPAWKAVLSNKGILAVLWRLFPEHPYLLPCYREPGRLQGTYVTKPMHSREGANIEITGEVVAKTSGSYAGPFVYQQYQKLFDADGKSAVIGSWIVGKEAAGIGIREDDSLVTSNISRFVPHYFT